MILSHSHGDYYKMVPGRLKAGLFAARSSVLDFVSVTVSLHS